jgi:DNA-binding MarR family transcriptional regulator
MLFDIRAAAAEASRRLFMAPSRAETPAITQPGVAETAFRQFLRTMGLLERVMQPWFARFGITGAQWGVIRNLHRAELQGEPALRLTDLSERLLIRPPSVTGVIDRLERAGLVARVDSAVDLRVKQVALTSRGRRLVERVLKGHSARIEMVMGALTPAEQGNLQELLHRLEGHLHALVETDASINDG